MTSSKRLAPGRGRERVLSVYGREKCFSFGVGQVRQIQFHSQVNSEIDSDYLCLKEF